MIQNMKYGNNANFVIFQDLVLFSTSVTHRTAALRIVTQLNNQFDVSMMVYGMYGIQSIADVGNWSITLFFEDSW